MMIQANGSLLKTAMINRTKKTRTSAHSEIVAGVFLNVFQLRRGLLLGYRGKALTKLLCLQVKRVC